jgi:hypothetical protein
VYLVLLDYNISLILKSNRDILRKTFVQLMIFNSLLFSIKLTSSNRWVSIYLFILLSGFSIIAVGGLQHNDVHGSVDCDRQTFSLIECPESSSGDAKTDNADTNDNIGNIEQQIPSILPFP